MLDAEISVRVPQDLRDRFVELAARQRYDLSDEVRRALWRHAEDPQNDERGLPSPVVISTPGTGARDRKP